MFTMVIDCHVHVVIDEREQEVDHDSITRKGQTDSTQNQSLAPLLV